MCGSVFRRVDALLETSHNVTVWLMWRRLLHLQGTARGIWLLCTLCALLGGLGLVNLNRWATRPRVWQPNETPVAFWTWRDTLPSAETVAQTQQATQMQTLFVRAGQFDLNLTTNSPQRIRAVKGAWFSDASGMTSQLTYHLTYHLTYNATKDFLAKLETIDAQAFADEVVAVWQTDAAEARLHGATIVGLQLDIDAPTRLLSHYAALVRAVRERLEHSSAGVQLSVTGLPTWMSAGNTDDLRQLLATVDFWIPQFYGGRIPTSLSEMRPIAAPEDVSRETIRARELGRPFYAGLAAYGYALRYDSQGQLTEVRGDVNPNLVATDERWQLVSRQQFTNSDRTPSGTWRYVFQARTAGANTTWAWQAGENLVLEVPTVESLRQTARAARTEGGPQMLGLCIFRLPDSTDATTLKLSQIVAALADTEATATQASFTTAWQAPEIKETKETTETKKTKALRESKNSAATSATFESSAVAGRVWRLELMNNGTVDAPLGDGALVVTLFVPPGQARLVQRGDFRTVHALCGIGLKVGLDEQHTRPCNPSRANILRLTAHAWPVGAKYSLALAVPDNARPDTWQTLVKMAPSN